MGVYVGILELDVLLGSSPVGPAGPVDSLKHKRSVIRPVLARLRRLDVAVTESSETADVHRRATIGVAAISGDPAQVNRVLDTCERQVAGEVEIDLLSAHRRMVGSQDE